MLFDPSTGAGEYRNRATEAAYGSDVDEFRRRREEAGYGDGTGRATYESGGYA